MRFMGSFKYFYLESVGSSSFYGFFGGLGSRGGVVDYGL